jgi:hypothetical protein
MTSTPVEVGPRSPRDLWHPSGAPTWRLEHWGEACAEPDAQHAGLAQLVVVGGARHELSRAALGGTISRAAARLARDGVMWVVVPRGWRGRAEREFARRRLVMLGAVMLVPESSRPAHLIPIERSTLRDAGQRHLGLGRVINAGLAALASSRVGRSLLRRSVPACALLAGHRPPPRPFGWLAHLDGQPAAAATVTVGVRTDARLAVAFRFPPGRAAPDLVVKAALDDGGRDRLRRERGALVALGPGAAGAGARVPALRPNAPTWALAMEVLPGTSAAVILARAPRRLEQIVAAVVAWSTAWSLSTASPQALTARVLEDTLLAPLAVIDDSGVSLSRYRDRLHCLAGRLEGGRISLTAAHNDLTMANVLVSRRGVGIVDWEAAAPDCLPLVDVWYAVVDALARAQRVSHAEALAGMVLGTSAAPAKLRRAPAALAKTLALTDDQVLAAFHACWLGHAANEVRRGELQGPFLAVVRAIAGGSIPWRAATPSNGGHP